MEIDKSLMKDSGGRYITQGLFLEVGYSDFSIYTLKEDDHTYKGKVYYSLKKLYLAHEDPTEYDFATKYLVGWRHWMRICDNKAIAPHVSEWREELELKLRSQAVRDIMDMADSYQASKWLADRGWTKGPVGRPNKAEKARQLRLDTKLADEFGDEVERMSQYRN